MAVATVVNGKGTDMFYRNSCVYNIQRGYTPLLNESALRKSTDKKKRAEAL